MFQVGNGLPRNEPFIGYPIPSSQTWNHTHNTKRAGQAGRLFSLLCLCLTHSNTNNKTGVMSLRENKGSRTWEGLKEEKGK